MAQPEIERLLRRGLLRIHARTALRWATGAALAAFFLAAAFVLAARAWPLHEDLLFTAAGLAFTAPLWALFAALLVAVRAHRRLATERSRFGVVAWEIDRHAGLEEVLTTWVEYCTVRAPAAHTEAREDAAPRAALLASLESAAVRAARQVRLARCLPLRWPPWSGALWLGVLVLCVALLVPPWTPERTRARETEREGRVAGAGLESAPEARSPESPATWRQVQLLSPTELYQLRLLALHPQLPQEPKQELLTQLERKLGGVEAGALSPEVTALLAALRRQVAPPQSGLPVEAGSPALNAGEAETVTGTGARPAAARVYPPAELVALSRAQYPDVAEALAKYYQERKP